MLSGQPIDYSLQPSSTEDAYEPDHIISFSKDPSKELDLNNIQATHRRCNRAKNNGTIVGLGKQSRIW